MLYLKLFINNHSISPKDNLKYRRVLPDNESNWKTHIKKVKTQLQEFVEFYPNLNIKQHNLYWKLSTTPNLITILHAQSSVGDVLQTQPLSPSLIFKIKL